jgi:hypothetical protein
MQHAPAGTTSGTQLYPIVTMRQVICSAAQVFAATTSMFAQPATLETSASSSRLSLILSRVQLQWPQLFQTWKQLRLQVGIALIPYLPASAAPRHSFARSGTAVKRQRFAEASAVTLVDLRRLIMSIASAMKGMNDKVCQADHLRWQVQHDAAKLPQWIAAKIAPSIVAHEPQEFMLQVTAPSSLAAQRELTSGVLLAALRQAPPWSWCADSTSSAAPSVSQYDRQTVCIRSSCKSPSLHLQCNMMLFSPQLLVCSCVRP